MDKQKWAEQNLKGLTLTQLKERYGRLERFRWFNILVAWGKVNCDRGISKETRANLNDKGLSGELSVSKEIDQPRAKQEVSQNIGVDPDGWISGRQIEQEFESPNALEEVEKDIKGREDSLRVKLNNLIKNAGGKMIGIEEINKLCDEWGYKHSNAERRLRASESPQVEAVMGPKKTGGEAIIGYKWVTLL